MRKVVHDAAAYIRGLAELRGRNIEWAERAVREAVSLSAAEALELKVVDLVATDLDDLPARSPQPPDCDRRPARKRRKPGQAAHASGQRAG